MLLELDIESRLGSFHLDVHCRLEEQTTGLFGPSGVGKTTLLHAIAGLVRPDAGRIVLDGRVLFDRSKRIHVPPHRRGVGMVFQDDRLFPHYSVRENLCFGEKMVSRGARRLRLETIVELLELSSLVDRSVNALSGGERRRVALGRTLLASPRLLLLDEPLAGLDNGRRQRILPLLARVRDELQIPIIMVSHDLTEIAHLTDNLLIVDQGSVTAQGKLSIPAVCGLGSGPQGSPSPPQRARARRGAWHEKSPENQGFLKAPPIGFETLFLYAFQPLKTSLDSFCHGLYCTLDNSLDETRPSDLCQDILDESARFYEG